MRKFWLLLIVLCLVLLPASLAGWGNDASDIANDSATVAGDSVADALDTLGAGGGGDVVGPAGATDGRIVLFDGVTGKLLKDSGSLLAVGDLTINNADPAVVYDGTTVGDTDYWSGVDADNDGVDDDFFSIGKGTVKGTDTRLSVDTNGNLHFPGDLYATTTTTLFYDNDLLTGDVFKIEQQYTNRELKANASEQAIFHPTAEFEQSGTACAYGLWLNMDTTSLGDGSSGDGNSLLNIQEDGVTEFRVDIDGGIHATGAHYRKRTASAVDYNPSALTSDYIIAITDTSVARAVTISTEDRDTGTTSLPRIFIIKDESGNAGANNITVSLETAGNIDGAATAVISGNYNSITVYIDGTNGWIY